MTKVSRKYIDPKDMGSYINNLWSAFTVAENKEDIRLLFKDLLTNTEYKMFAIRFEIARRLIKKDRYEDITRDLGVTANTISNVSNVLSDKGQGYRKSNDKLVALEERYYLENSKRKSLLRKVKRKTVMGAILKAGIKTLDKKIVKTIKNKSARRNLPL